MTFIKNTVLIIVSLTFLNNLQAQSKPRFGIRAGLNLSTIMSKTDANSLDGTFEQQLLRPKITVAATMQYQLAKQIGIGAEVSFTQRGMYYRYEGDSYLKVPTENFTFEGHERRIGLNVIHGYVDVPVFFYVEAIPNKLTFDVGPSVGFLVSAGALGSLKYIDEDYPDEFVEFDLDYRYFRDDLHEVKSTNQISGKVDGTTINLPQRIGAYYLNDTQTKSLYKPLDFGINIGAAYNFTPGLRFGTRVYYGFQDITNNEMDIRQSALDENRDFQYNNDFDRNFGVQIFLGLQF